MDDNMEQEMHTHRKQQEDQQQQHNNQHPRTNNSDTATTGFAASFTVNEAEGQVSEKGDIIER